MSARTQEQIERRRLQQREYYKNNREKIMQRTSLYAKNNPDIPRKSSKAFTEKKYKEFIEFKKTLSCLDCGMDDFRCLEFHHLDPNEKEDNLSNLYRHTKKFLEELKKCVVLCANCHKIRHFEDE